MEKLFFSVIIPTLNEEKFLPLLLDSLVTQTNKNFEVIVVDGRSKDKTIAVAQTYKTKLPSLTIISSKRGLPLQRNVGAKAARGEWFVFSDADNTFLPYAIDRMEVFVKKTKAPLFTPWTRSDSDTSIDAIIGLVSDLVVEGSILFKRQFTPGPLTIVKQTAFEFVGGYTEGLAWGEDFDFGKKLHAKKIPLSILRETLYIWSLRRFRHEGTINVMRKFFRNILQILITNKAMTHMPGYIMGGHIYSHKKKKLNTSILKQLEQTIQKFTKELFE